MHTEDSSEKRLVSSRSKYYYGLAVLLIAILFTVYISRRPSAEDRLLSRQLQGTWDGPNGVSFVLESDGIATELSEAFGTNNRGRWWVRDEVLIFEPLPKPGKVMDVLEERFESMFGNDRREVFEIVSLSEEKLELRKAETGEVHQWKRTANVDPTKAE